MIDTNSCPLALKEEPKQLKQIELDLKGFSTGIHA